MQLLSGIIFCSPLEITSYSSARWEHSLLSRCVRANSGVTSRAPAGERGRCYSHHHNQLTHVTNRPTLPPRPRKVIDCCSIKQKWDCHSLRWRRENCLIWFSIAIWVFESYFTVVMTKGNEVCFGDVTRCSSFQLWPGWIAPQSKRTAGLLTGSITQMQDWKNTIQLRERLKTQGGGCLSSFRPLGESYKLSLKSTTSF